MSNYTTELKNWLGMRREALDSGKFKSTEGGGYLEAVKSTMEGVAKKKKPLSRKQKFELREKKRGGGK